jgi:hypothetical protein
MGRDDEVEKSVEKNRRELSALLQRIRRTIERRHKLATKPDSSSEKGASPHKKKSQD